MPSDNRESKLTLSEVTHFNLGAAARGLTFFRACVDFRQQSRTTDPRDYALDQLENIYRRVQASALSTIDGTESPELRELGMTVLRAFRDWIDEGIRIGEMDGAA